MNISQDLLLFSLIHSSKEKQGVKLANKITNMGDENKKLEQEIEDLKDTLKERDDELAKIKKDFNIVTGERNDYINRTRHIQLKFGEGEELNLAEMQKALMTMDPSVFRDTMENLKYDGDEPIWAKIDFLEQIGVDTKVNPKDPKSMVKCIERLKQDKREIAAALEKTQQLLKLQYDIERENKAYYQEEIEEIRLKNRELTIRLEESRKLADARQQEIITMKQKGVPRGVDEDRLPDHDRVDVESEFSFATLETDLKHEENVLDFAVDKGEYYGNSLLQVVDSDFVSEKGLLTFITVEFYDHDTKATDVVNGLTPSYSTLFSFKNKIDDYYIQFLQGNRVKLEIFINKAQRVQKIGFGNVALRELIERDYDTMEGMKAPVINGLINIMSSANPSLRIGSIKYKMRMRRSLNEALKWYREKNDLTVAEPGKVTQKIINTKVVAINILSCTDLYSKNATSQKEIRPFFFYNFYINDEYCSKIVRGNSPEYNDLQTYSTEIDSKFKKYTEQK
jgi:hypothetical protein